MELSQIFYLNLKNKGLIYKNQFKYWTRYSYFWRYSDTDTVNLFLIELSLNIFLKLANLYFCCERHKLNYVFIVIVTKNMIEFIFSHSSHKDL
jgi:hypothetical protein